MTTTMQRGVFAVQTIDADTGKESEVRVEATGRDEAIGKVASLGAIVGACRLIEVAGNAPPAVPGLVTCPKCGGTEWEGSRKLWFWVCVVIFFPLGLLLLFIVPTWTCERCRFTYRAFTTPASTAGPKPLNLGKHLISGLLWGMVVSALLIGWLFVQVATQN